MRALSGQQMALQRDRGRLEGPFPNWTTLCRPERALRSVLYQTGGPSVGLGGSSVGLMALYLSGRALCRSERALQSVLCHF